MIIAKTSNMSAPRYFHSEKLGKIISQNGINWHRNGFVHYSIISACGQEFTAKCCYINRTWERFEFETSMKNAAYSCKDEAVRGELLRIIDKMN